MAIDIDTSLRMVHPFSSPACAAALHYAVWWSSGVFRIPPGVANLSSKPILRATFLTLPLDALFSLSLSPFSNTSLL